MRPREQEIEPKFDAQIWAQSLTVHDDWAGGEELTQ